MRAASRRAQQRLALLRGRSPDTRRKATVADPHELTNRERDVLELLATGHSNAEIAAALYISPKTANRPQPGTWAPFSPNSASKTAPRPPP